MPKGRGFTARSGKRINSILFRLEPNNDLKCVVGLHLRRAASGSCEFVISIKYGEEILDRHKTIPDRRKRRSGYTPRRVLGVLRRRHRRASAPQSVLKWGQRSSSKRLTMNTPPAIRAVETTNAMTKRESSSAAPVCTGTVFRMV